VTPRAVPTAATAQKVAAVDAPAEKGNENCQDVFGNCRYHEPHFLPITFVLGLDTRVAPKYSGAVTGPSKTTISRV
jgi:hypothetical protein